MGSDDPVKPGEDGGEGPALVEGLPILSLYGLHVACGLPLCSPVPRVGRGAGAAGEPGRGVREGGAGEGGGSAAIGAPADSAGEPAADLVVVAAAEPPPQVAAARRASASPVAGPVLWESPERDPDDRPATRLERLADWDVLRFPGIADFHLRGRRIVAVPAAGASPALVELRLLGPVLAYWLELQGVVTLHASAAVLDGRAVAFLAGNHAGKTNLALAMMEAGGALLTDDLLAVAAPSPAASASPSASAPGSANAPGSAAAPGASPAAPGGRSGGIPARSSVAVPGASLPPRPADAEDPAAPFLARSGYPQVRLWVPDAERLLPGRARDLPPVHPAYDKRRVPVGEGGVGRFHPEPAALAAVFLPEHRPDVDRVGVEPLAPPEAVIALLAGSYLPRLAPAAGLQEGRLDLLARLVETVPVRRLVYPRGVEHLPRVAGAVHGILRRPGRKPGRKPSPDRL